MGGWLTGPRGSDRVRGAPALLHRMPARRGTGRRRHRGAQGCSGQPHAPEPDAALGECRGGPGPRVRRQHPAVAAALGAEVRACLLLRTSVSRWRVRRAPASLSDSSMVLHPVRFEWIPPESGTRIRAKHADRRESESAVIRRHPRRFASHSFAGLTTHTRSPFATPCNQRTRSKRIPLTLPASSENPVI
jgi:hypothetical protein